MYRASDASRGEVARAVVESAGHGGNSAQAGVCETCRRGDKLELTSLRHLNQYGLTRMEHVVLVNA